MPIRKNIQDWEKHSSEEGVDPQQQRATMDFLLDLGSTRGRVSLFQQTVKMYWRFKCVLAKSLMSMKEQDAHSSLLFELNHIKQDMTTMTKVQQQQNDRIGRIEEQLRDMQWLEVLGSDEDPAPVKFFDV